jgi:hypothetical protein
MFYRAPKVTVLADVSHPNVSQASTIGRDKRARRSCVAKTIIDAADLDVVNRLW